MSRARFDHFEDGLRCPGCESGDQHAHRRVISGRRSGATTNRPRHRARRPIFITLRDDARGLSITTSGTRRLSQVGITLALAALGTFQRIGKKRRR